MTNDATDTRHPRERERDQTLWATLFGGHSPRDEVAASPGMTALAIAEAAWQQYAPDAWDDLDREDTIASLTRTLNHEGGAPLATPRMSAEEHADARKRYAAACERILVARKAGKHAEAAKIARSILDLENALNAHEAGA